MKSFVLAAALLGLAAGGPIHAQSAAAQRPSEPSSAQQHRHAESTEAGGMMMQDREMMEMHQKMMAEMKAADERLDQLVATMKAASGDEKVEAIAAVVSELVEQRQEMRDRMMAMQPRMMGHMMQHMSEGMPQEMKQQMEGSMNQCPMMSMMQGRAEQK